MLRNLQSCDKSGFYFVIMVNGVYIFACVCLGGGGGIYSSLT